MVNANEPVDVGTFKQSDVTNRVLKNFMQGKDPFSKHAKGPVGEDSLPDIAVPESPEALAAELQKAVDSVNKAPEKTWKQQLESLGVSEEEAFEIIDAMMSKGYYEKEYAITKKTSVTFRTRDFKAHEAMQRAIETDAPQFMGTVSMIMAKYNLAGSLVKYGSRTFKLNSNKQPEAAFDFIADLPYMVFTVLLDKLSKFDTLVLTVMDEGALENF